MKNTAGFVAVSVCLVSHAAAQTELYGFRTNGDLLKIDPATGQGTLIGNNGIGCSAAMSHELSGPAPYGPPNGEGMVIAGSGAGAEGPLQRIDRWTGAVWFPVYNSAVPPGFSIHALAYTGYTIFAILRSNAPPAQDSLARFDLYQNEWTIIGATGRADLESLAFRASPSFATLYALGTSDGGTLCTLSTTTGLATIVGGGSFGPDTQALTCLPDGTLLAGGANLRSVEPLTGATTLIGPIGFTDLRGLSTVTRAACYANCDVGQVPPQFNAVDFQCFLNRFASGDPYANCDESTTPPVLNVNDFMCFLNTWAAGCP